MTKVALAVEKEDKEETKSGEYKSPVFTIPLILLLHFESVTFTYWLFISPAPLSQSSKYDLEVEFAHAMDTKGPVKLDKHRKHLSGK